MAAADTYATERAQRAFRRRRAALGVACAVVVLAATGGGLAGAADPPLQDRIDSAQSDAGRLSNRIEAQSQRIASLMEQARQAGARAMVLNAQVERAQSRSRELAAELEAAERRLDRLRMQYAVSVKQLDQRLIAIYESDAPDEMSVVLNSDGFDDLTTRSDYLQALHEADRRIAHRVASLRDRVAARADEIADLKQQVDQQGQELAAARASFAASEQAANRDAAAVAAARSATQADLSAVEDRVAELEQEQIEQQQQQQQASAGAPAYLGGPYAIPTYIVMCESGGNYHALNASSGAGGAYQILPSTWRAYGGQGAPQDAPKAEQDRIAAEIWRDSGPSAWSCA
ncbi:MAG TPA: transglycosylase family protein [Solirubrobacterales bacterium]|nr:transglycosylase family protein [Solirubrobacterales bacterium]